MHGKFVDREVIVEVIYETKYSRMDQVKFVKEALKIFTWSTLEYLDSYVIYKYIFFFKIIDSAATCQKYAGIRFP